MPTGEMYKIEVDESVDLMNIIKNNMDFILIGIIVILLFCVYKKYKNKEEESIDFKKIWNYYNLLLIIITNFKKVKKNKYKNKDKEVKEVKVVYDHRPNIIINNEAIKELQKNMSIPSKLWDD